MKKTFLGMVICMVMVSFLAMAFPVFAGDNEDNSVNKNNHGFINDGMINSNTGNISPYNSNNTDSMNTVQKNVGNHSNNSSPQWNQNYGGNQVLGNGNKINNGTQIEGGVNATATNKINNENTNIGVNLNRNTNNNTNLNANLNNVTTDVNVLNSNTVAPKISNDNTNIVSPTISTEVSPKISVSPTMSNGQDQKQTQGQGQNQTQNQNQRQGQDQAQSQDMNNSQNISPSQEITIINPDKLAVGSAPAITDSGLDFIRPSERDIQTSLPRFGCDIATPLTQKDCIVDVLWQSNDVKFKSLYKEILKGLRHPEVTKYGKAVRYQVREASSTKSWTTGGEIAGNAVGMAGNAVTGGTAGLLPKVGRSKSSNLYTIIFVLVQEFK